MRRLLVLLLAGCASSGQAPAPAPTSAAAAESQYHFRWHNTLGADTRAQFDLDSAQCENLALSADAARVSRGVQLFGPCMRGRGWRLQDR